MFDESENPIVCEPEEPTVYDAIVELANPEKCEDVNELNNFLTSKMMNKPIEFISDIITMLFDEDIPQNNHFYLLVHLSNAISTRIRSINFFTKNWETIFTIVAQNLNIQEDKINLQEINDNFHSRLISFLSEEKNEIRQNASLCISNLFYIELQLDLWDDFYPNIFETIIETSNSECLIDGCFQILINLIKMQVIYNEMHNFELVISSIYDIIKIYIGSPDTDVGLRALCLRMNSKAHYMLDCFLSQEEELKNYVNILLLNLRDINDKTIHRLTYKLLKKTFARYTENVFDLMETIFLIVCNDLNLDDSENKALAIDFWLGVAISESDKKQHLIISAVAPQLIPVFLQFLISDTDVDRKKSIFDNGDRDFADDIEVDIEENQNTPVIDNSIVCLRHFVMLESDISIPIIIPFIEENFNSENISLNIASLNAAYSVLKFDEFSSILNEMMPRLLEMASQEESTELRTCALFILSKALSNHPKLIEDGDCFNYLVSIVEKNVNSIIEPDSEPIEISDEKKILILEKSFSLLSKIIDCFSDDEEMQSFLGENFVRVWSISQSVFDNFPFYREEPPLIILIFETIGDLISNLPIELEEQISNALSFAHNNIIEEISNCQSNAAVFISANCALIYSISYKMRDNINPFVPDIMDTLIKLFSKIDEEVFIEAFKVIEAFIYFCKEDIYIYYDTLSEILLNIFSADSFVNTNLLKQATRVIARMFQYSRSELIQKAEHFYDYIIPLFGLIIQDAPVSPQQKELNTGIGSKICSPLFPREILPCIIEAISAITAKSPTKRKSKFIKIMPILSAAQKIQIDVSQSDDIDFAYSFYQSILYSYNILIRILDGQDSSLIMLNMKQILTAFENMDHFSVMTKRSLILFLNIVEKLVDQFRFQFCKLLVDDENYNIIGKILDFIKNSPEEKLHGKANQINEKIDKCLHLQEAYNYV